jgi:hypothetical protein
MRILLRPLFAFLVAISYLVATVVAAETPLASCPALETGSHGPHTHHDHGHQHHHGSRTKADECLKCCLGACLVVPGLPGPNVGASQLAFIGVQILYWSGSSSISGYPAAPDPGPPRPIA